MIYVDTSALVAMLTPEPEAGRVLQWFDRNETVLVSSDWCRVEFSSAVAAKLRAKQIRRSQFQTALDAFDTLAAGGLRLLPISRDASIRAAALCARVAEGLRAGDALHLACALEAGAESLAGLDAVMNKAAKRLGLSLALQESA